jgi:Photosynthetic reaction centre cytochrome C subunit
MRLLVILIVGCHAAPPPLDLASPITASGRETPIGLDWGTEGGNPASTVFKNVKVLGALTGDRFMAAMQSMKTNLGHDCELCHAKHDFVSDAKPEKERARVMIRMVDAINHRTFGGAVRVTCWTCHRGHEDPGTRPFPKELTGMFAQMTDDELGKPIEETFKDVRILTGMNVKQFGLIMRWFTQELGVDCAYCHAGGAFAADTPHKKRARQMLDMTGYIGKDFYDNKSPVMCGTCHKGATEPPRVPTR